MNQSRPGPVNPPAPEGLVVMTVKLATDKVRQRIGLEGKSKHPWVVPPHFMCFASKDASGEHLEVTIDMAGWTPSCEANFVGVTVDAITLSEDADLFTVAVAGAVTIAASCEDMDQDSLTYCTPGDTVWWRRSEDTQGFTTAPDIRTLSIVGTNTVVPSLSAADLAAIDPIFEAVRSLNYDDVVTVGDKTWTVAELKRKNRLWAASRGDGGPIGMLLAKGSYVQHEIRVLLAPS